MTYQIIKIKDEVRMLMLNQTGISVCLVIKPSKNAAIKMIGIIPAAIFVPSLALEMNDWARV